MSTLLSNEFPVDIKARRGQGTLLVTDGRLLLRPPVTGQHYYALPYDSAHAISLLSLGDNGDGSTWHIVSDMSARDSERTIGEIIKIFVDWCCSAAYTDARINYIGEFGEIIHQNGEDTSALTFNVYCSKFWRGLPSAEASWGELLDHIVGASHPGPVTSDTLEEYLAGLTESRPSMDSSCIVARPVVASEPFSELSIRGFRV